MITLDTEPRARNWNKALTGPTLKQRRAVLDAVHRYKAAHPELTDREALEEIWEAANG